MQLKPKMRGHKISYMWEECWDPKTYFSFPHVLDIIVTIF